MSSLNVLTGFRSHFSLGESVLTPADIVKTAKDAGLTEFAVCDTMNISCQIDLTKKATKEGLRPVVGVRLRVVRDALREKGSNRGAAMIKVFPRNEAGQVAINNLLSRAFVEDRFYEVPRLTWADLSGLSHVASDLVFTTGDLDSLFGSPEAPALLTELAKVVPLDQVYAELLPIDTPMFDRQNANAISAIKRHGMKPLLSRPILYQMGGFETFVVSMAIQRKSTTTRRASMFVPHYEDARPHSPAEIVKEATAAKERLSKRYPGLDQAGYWRDALLNTDAFLKEAAHVWTKQPVSLPTMNPDPDHAIAKVCAEGMKERLFKPVNGFQPTTEQIRDEYLPRLRYELGVLKDMGFATYFLVVSDVVNWSKENGILVGPGRGSVGGSLVAYLMGITDVDPIRFGLLFERFINPQRNDLPDADLDFMSTRRHEVVDYLETRHGSDYVAGISNYGELGSASGMRDVARIYGHDLALMTASKLVPKVHGQPVDLKTAAAEVPAIQEWADRHPDEWKHAVALEGTMRSYGKHAAGVIVSGVKLTERAVVERREGARIVNWNMAVAEDAGLVKLDILGLSTLDTLARALIYIKDRHGITLDLGSIPLDDAKTLDLFATGRTQGIFQFEGGAARRILTDMSAVNPLTFDDLVAANALNRPGPIEAGLVTQYVEAKNGMTTIPLPHPNMKAALDETFNVLCYQEQVMRVSVDLCGFNLSEADKLRKAMGKKDPVLMASFREKFVDGAFTTSGMDKHEAGDLFDQIEKFAGYAFNKSHAVEYSLISYQVAYLKAHYPVEFFAAALSTVDEAKLPSLVGDAQKMGINVMPPDVNISTDEFVIANDKTLIIPFNRMKGMSDKAARAIMDARAQTSYEVEIKTKVGRKVEVSIERRPCRNQFASIEEFRARVPARLVNVGHMDKLAKVGAFHRIDPGSPHPQDESRQRDQHELLPGLMVTPVRVDRAIPTDKYASAAICQVYADLDANFPKTVITRPFFGKKPRFAVVFDCPSRGEENNKKVASSDSFQSVAEALFKAGLGRNDGYWTTLVKKAKEGGNHAPVEFAAYGPYLERELEALKPPLIIALGTNAARHFIPDLKGSIFDHVGKLVYDRKRDCNILIGFAPGMIFFDPDKQDALDELFERASTLVV